MRDINCVKQNRLRLIVDDIRAAFPDVPADFIYEVLLMRGAFKWFAVREDVIKLKERLKEEVKSLQARKPPRLRGYLRALESCRKQLRAITHSPRLRAASRDREGTEFLRRYVKDRTAKDVLEVLGRNGGR